MQNTFEEIYQKNVDKLYKFIYYKVWNHTDTEDILSETFVKIYHNIHKYNSQKAKIETWIYKIAQNTCIDRFKKNQNISAYDRVNDPWHEEDLLQQIEDKEKLKKILEFLNWINPKHKQIIIMKLRDNLSYQEISEIIWISSSAAKQIFHRNIKQIISRFWLILVICIAHNIKI